MLNKLQTLLMICTQTILGFKLFKFSTMEIMEELKIRAIHHMIINETIQFVYKIILNEFPKVIKNLFTYSKSNSQNIRSKRKLIMVESHKSQNVTNSLFFRAIYFFNQLDSDIRIYNPKKLSKYLQANIKYVFPYNKMPRAEYNLYNLGSNFTKH